MQIVRSAKLRSVDIQQTHGIPNLGNFPVVISSAEKYHVPKCIYISPHEYSGYEQITYFTENCGN